MPNAILILESGERRGESISVTPPRVRLGRAPDNDIVLEDDTITSHHARIDVRRDRYRVLDLGSRNGTFVNDTRVQIHELRDGDVLRLGASRLRFSVLESGVRAITGPGLDQREASAILRGYRTTAPPSRDPRTIAAAHAHLRMVMDLTDRINAEYDVDAVLRSGLQLFLTALVPDRVVFLCRDRETGKLRRHLSHADGPQPRIAKEVLRQAVQAGQAIRVTDAHLDDRLTGGLPDAERPRALLCVPLRGDKEVLGACYADRLGPDRPFGVEHLQLATLIANVLGQRLEHIRLYQEILEVETLKAINREMAETNTKLRELEQFKTDMTGMLVHDMKGAVSTTMMSIDMVDQDMGDRLTTLSRRYLGTARRNQHKLNEMIMNILQVTRFEEGKLTPELSPLHFGELARRFAENMEPYAASAGIRLAVEVPADLTFWSDPDLVERMILNLVLNAINHSPEETAVTVRARRLGPDGVELAVADEGEGIPPDLHERIFDKFAQAEAREYGLKTDVGLGLTFCKLAATALGGDIGVDSAVGHGSTFTITLPDRPPTEL